MNSSDPDYTPLVEDGTVTFAGYSGKLGVLRRYHVDQQKWDEPYFFPKKLELDEGSLIRAENGNLVSAWRRWLVGAPGLKPGHEFPNNMNSWMGLAPAIRMMTVRHGRRWTITFFTGLAIAA